MEFISTYAPGTLFRTQPLRMAGARVDRKAGVIYGYAVLTIGEALGHNLWVDAVALQQVVSMGNAAKAGVKSRFTHPGLCSDGMGKFLGRTRNFRLDGNLVRGDLYFSPVADRSPEGKLASYVMDLAESDPDMFGASIVFEGDEDAQAKFVAEHGFRNFQSPDPNNVKNLPHMRVGLLKASDVVDDPAANPSGFFGNVSELTSRAEAVLGYLFGVSEVAPDANALGGLAPEKAKTFVAGFLSRHGISLNRKEKSSMARNTKKFDDGGDGGGDAGGGDSSGSSMEAGNLCPHCGQPMSAEDDPANKKMDDGGDGGGSSDSGDSGGSAMDADAPPAKFPTPPSGGGSAGGEGGKQNEDKGAGKGKAVNVNIASNRRPNTGLNRDEIIHQERNRARAYEAQFKDIMAAARFSAEERESFREKYFGRDLQSVRDFANLMLSSRTQPVGEGGAGAPASTTQGQAAGGTKYLSAEERAAAMDRFKNIRSLRITFGYEGHELSGVKFEEALAKFLQAQEFAAESRAKQEQRKAKA